MTTTEPTAPTEASGWSGYFDEYAPTYEAAAFGGAGLALISERELRAVRDALACAEPGRVLDAGAGTGRITETLLSTGWSVVALDASAEMLNELRQAHPEVETIEARLGTRLPFDDATFDAVVAMRVLKYVDDIEYALRELARVVRPGGHVVVEFANRRSCARLGYGDAPIHLVTMREADAGVRAAGLDVQTLRAGPRLPQPVWAEARTPLSARLASACDRAVAIALGGHRSSFAARCVFVSATRR
jgi:ubiquinone/menaquinone biosynthesis C-methylase UbiE